jgi:hypothetical protein
METIKGLLGLIVLGGPAFFLLSYAVIALIIVKIVAKKGGKCAGRYIALFFIFVMFWDLPLVLGTFHYQCDNNAGFTVYKTLDEWKAENPELSETLIPITQARSSQQDNVTRYPLNQRFVWTITESRWPVVGLNKRVEHISDTKTNAILAEYIDFNTLDEKPHVWNVLNPQDLKFWLRVGSCEMSDGTRTRPQNFSFNKFMYLMQYQKEYR